MNKVIDLLKAEREETKRLIKWLKKEIKNSKKAVKELQSPEFIERHKDINVWTEDWTVKDFIKLNVNAYNRAITKYTKKLEEANEYLRQVESALTVLNESSAVEEHFYHLRKKYADAMKELDGRR